MEQQGCVKGTLKLDGWFEKLDLAWFDRVDRYEKGCCGCNFGRLLKKVYISLED